MSQQCVSVRQGKRQERETLLLDSAANCFVRSVLIRLEPKSPRTSQRAARRRQPWTRLAGEGLSRNAGENTFGLSRAALLCCALLIASISLFRSPPPLPLPATPPHQSSGQLHQHSEKVSLQSASFHFLPQPARAACCPASSKKAPAARDRQRCAGVGLGDFLLFENTSDDVSTHATNFRGPCSNRESKVLATPREIIVRFCARWTRKSRWSCHTLDPTRHLLLPSPRHTLGLCELSALHLSLTYLT